MEDRSGHSYICRRTYIRRTRSVRFSDRTPIGSRILRRPSRIASSSSFRRTPSQWQGVLVVIQRNPFTCILVLLGIYSILIIQIIKAVM